MTPALALIITLQNAVVACESHAVTSAATGTVTYERGFEQCVYVVPEATKRINLFYIDAPAMARAAAARSCT